MNKLNQAMRFGAKCLIALGVSGLLMAGVTMSGPVPPPPIEDIGNLKSGPVPPPPIEDIGN